MKQVIEQYASTIVAVILSSAIFGILMGTTFFHGQDLVQTIGSVYEYTAYASELPEGMGQEFDAYMEGAVPVITVKNNYALVKGKRTLISECLEARSENGSALSVYADGAWQMNGVEVDCGLSEDKTSICIAEAGSYWVSAYAIDEKGKEQHVLVKLLVNAR